MLYVYLWSQPVAALATLAFVAPLAAIAAARPPIPSFFTEPVGSGQGSMPTHLLYEQLDGAPSRAPNNNVTKHLLSILMLLA